MKSTIDYYNEALIEILINAGVTQLKEVKEIHALLKVTLDSKLFKVDKQE